MREGIRLVVALAVASVCRWAGYLHEIGSLAYQAGRKDARLDVGKKE